jgi:hypothetical protein
MLWNVVKVSIKNVLSVIFAKKTSKACNFYKCYMLFSNMSQWIKGYNRYQICKMTFISSLVIQSQEENLSFSIPTHCNYCPI